MRIEAYNAVSQVYQSNTKLVAKTNTIANANDKFEISQTAKSYQVAKQAVNAAPDIRQDKVADIKAKMSAGAYTVKPEDFADKVMGSASTLIF